VRQDPVDQVFELLADGNRPEALTRLDELLREEPYQGALYALRALISSDLGALDSAAADAVRAREITPDHPFVYYATGVVALEQGAMLEAIQASQTARRLAPEYADAVLLEARARAALGQWDRVLAIAGDLVMREPDNEGAALLATIAREQQHQGPLSPEAWKQLAERFPLNAVARTGAGWTRLNAGQIQAARAEFEQALSLDPALPWAKEGLVLALKARNPAYALLLRFFIWFSRLESRTRTIILVGGLIGYNVLRYSASARPELKPFILPVLVAYLAFLALSWLADPLLNLLLMARPEGRRLLDADARRSALLVGACLAGAAVLGLASLAGRPSLLLSAFAVGFASFAVSAAYGHRGRRRRQLKGLAGTAIVAGLAAGVVSESLQGGMLLVAVLGVVAATWLSHFGTEAPH